MPSNSQSKSTPKVLMSAEDISIDRNNIKVPSGEYPLADIRSVRLDTKQPLLGPVSLALLGTVILGMAVNASSLLDIGVALFLLVAGLFWRIRGIQHLLLMKTESTLEEEAIWFTRDRKLAEQAQETLRGEIARRQREMEA